jgi:hypothetical protein
LVKSIRKHGIMEPLVITLDDYIVSGHRRHAAAKAAGLKTVPCRRHPTYREFDTNSHILLLREYNRQRTKTLDERRREELLSVDSGDAYTHLKEYRRQKSTMVDFIGQPILMGSAKTRKKISDAKLPLLNAVIKVIEDNRDHWPLSDRRIHYLLLNDPPLIHAGKPGSVYTNTLKDYKNGAVDILARGRVAGHIPWEAIEDETRPFTMWKTSPEAADFIAEKTSDLFAGYWRNLMQSQPNHIEIIGEKLTVRSTIESVAQDYCIPVTIGRGYASLDPRYKLSQRFKRSGRDKLVLVFLTDFDPEGEDIAASFTRSLRDDFSIAEDRVQAAKVALNREQIDRFELPPKMTAKKTSSRYESFMSEHGENCWELDALPPAVLADELRNAINSVIDVEAFEHEREQEIADAQDIEATRRAAIKAMRGEA